MSTSKPATITQEEWIIVGSVAAGFIILTIIAFAGGLTTMFILLPILAVLLPVAVVVLAIWLLYKFGAIIVRDGILAADAVRASRASITPDATENL